MPGNKSISNKWTAEALIRVGMEGDAREAIQEIGRVEAAAKAADTAGANAARANLQRTAESIRQSAGQQEAALRQLAGISQRLQLERLTGFDRERAAAQLLFEERKKQIRDLATQGGLGQGSIDRLTGVARSQLVNTLSGIDGRASTAGIAAAATAATGPLATLESKLTSVAGLAGSLGLGGALASGGIIGLGSAAGGGLAYAIHRAIEESDEADQRLKTLALTLKSNRQYSDEYLATLLQQSEAQAEVTKATAAQIQAGQALLISFGAQRQALPRLIEQAQNLSVALRQDLQTSVQSLARAVAGEFTTFTRLGINFRQDATDAEKLESLLQQLESRFGGLARGELNTLTGQTAQLTKAWADLYQTIGQTFGLDKALGKFKELTTAGVQAAKTAIGSLDATPAERAEKYSNILRNTLATQEALLRVELALEKSAERRRELQVIIGNTLRAQKAGDQALPVELRQQLVAANDTFLKSRQPQPAAEPSADEAKATLEAARLRAEALREFRALQQSVSIDSLDQIAKERAAVDAAAQAKKDKLIQLAQAAGTGFESDLQKGFQDIETAAARSQEAITAKLGTDYDQIIQAEIRRGLDNHERLLKENAEHVREELSALERDIANDSLGTLKARLNAPFEATNPKIQTLRQEVSQGTNPTRDLQSLSGELDREFAIRKQQIDSEFGQRIAKYQELAAQGLLTEQELTRFHAEAESQRTRDTTLQENQRKKVIRDAAEDYRQHTLQVAKGIHESFAGGLAGTIVDGFRKGRFEMKAFFADFLAQIAQAILKAALLRVLTSALGGTGSFVGALGLARGGVVMAADGIQTLSKDSGFASPLTTPRPSSLAPTFAAAGIQSVSTPTYFPRHNVVAGEAGRELLTVLSRPKTTKYQFASGPVMAAEGYAQGVPLSVLPTAALQSNRPPGTPATGTPQLTTQAIPNPQLASPSRVEVAITLDPGLRAEITKSSSDAAVAIVQRDLTRQSPISQSVRQLAKT